VFALLENNADVNARTSGRQTALHLAATLAGSESTAAGDADKERAADEARGADGEEAATPLTVEPTQHGVDSKGRTVLKLLLQAQGCNASLVNEQGETAAQVAARRSGNDDLFKLADPCLGMLLPPPPF
jgi:ankyrin repeat protein